MPTFRLTPTFVESAECPADRRRIDYFDREVTGFLMEVRATSGKTYFQRYRDAKGRIRQVKVGLPSQLTLDQARQKGRDIAAAVVLGSNPQEDRVTSRATPTLREFILGRYVPFVSGQKKSWRIDERHFRINILPTPRSVPVGRDHP